jgi:hypothetical protein
VGPVRQPLSCLGASSMTSSSRPVGQVLSSLQKGLNYCHDAPQLLWKVDWEFDSYEWKWTRNSSVMIASNPKLTLASHDSLSVAAWQHAGVAIETGLLH